MKSKGKQPYAGPAEVVVLPAAPMLDGEGKQRLDPDGKPMFNPPVKQQRDKSGHPLFDAKGQPVFQTASDLGYDEHGKKLHATKEKPPKTIAISIAQGTLTVDGMIGKAAMNYDIADLRYIYLYAPWIGTVVVSNTMFPGAKEQAGGFNQNTLTVKVEEHTFQLASEMGYGATLNPPYAWPGAKKNAESKAPVKPPAVPVTLRPTQLLPPCPAGQMRAASHVALPGEDAPAEPCVRIVDGRAAVVSKAVTAPTIASPIPAAAPAAPAIVPSAAPPL